MNLPHGTGLLLMTALPLVLGGCCGWLLRGRGRPAAAPPPPAAPPPATSADTWEAATVDSLVTGVAHEVRNILFSISTTLDAFEARHGASQVYLPYTTNLRAEQDRINGLIEQLLEYGRPSAPVFAPGHLADVLRQAIETTEPLALEGDVTIRVDPAEPGLPGGGDPPLRLDADRLLRALRHLLRNAIQFSPPGGCVTVRVGRPDAGTLSILVEDSGPGLPEGDPGQVFEPFFSRRRGGAGLGLAIARRIAGEHGGTLTAANRSEGGACLELRLPLTTPTGPTPISPPPTPRAADSSVTPSGSATSGAPRG